MYIGDKRPIRGYTSYLSCESGKGRDIDMDVGLLILEAGDEFTDQSADKEAAYLLFEGSADWTAAGRTAQVSRKDPFDEAASCLHVAAGTAAFIKARTHAEIYVQRTHNDTRFPAVFYSPENVQVQRAGSHGELGGTMRRNIITLFDYDNAPYSKMVLGEVLNFPGRWSSYPPHHHPQPEVYFYRFDHPQGFGAGFANGEIVKTTHNGLLVIENGFHSQAAAPGYALCYVWGIRHLEGDPWRKTRIDDEEHLWLTKPDPAVWYDKNEEQ